jgi:hypothetical protein
MFYSREKTYNKVLNLIITANYLPPSIQKIQKRDLFFLHSILPFSDFIFNVIFVGFLYIPENIGTKLVD